MDRHAEPFPEDLFQFAWLAHKNVSFDQFVIELSKKAQTENWGVGNKILKNYLSFTFRYLSQAANEELRTSKKTRYIINVGNSACFNTGLFDDYYEPIYAYFKRNRMTGPAAKQPWFLIGFKSAGDYELREFSELPIRMNYFTNPDQLVFDPRLEIRTNVRHILGDEENIGRLPLSFQQMDSAGLATILNGCIDNAKKEAASNYTIAVPQYYKGSLQLLLPLVLPGSNTPDLALTITKGQNIYFGNTCLTIEMAYNNARLITKPSSSWLIATDAK